MVSCLEKPGTFAKFPDAVVVLLEYVANEVCRMPMSRPRFRVDAKAEGELIVVGGWEVGPKAETKTARWFSVVLSRKSAPWAYLKGEPFRNLSSLELVVVLIAVMLFGDSMVEAVSKKRLTLTASTDNLGNCYVLKHFMSCKYPLSIVVMELALQLQRLGLELDLGWVPRGQNAEADALTNEEFEGFDPDRRIKVNFEEMNFIIMGKLMGKAGELDEEIKLAKSSKEAKGDRPFDSGEKRKKGQTRWED